MMRKNVITRLKKEQLGAVVLAVKAATVPLPQGRGAPAGMNVNGEWVPFGRADITPVDTGSGFIAS